MIAVQSHYRRQLDATSVDLKRCDVIPQTYYKSFEFCFHEAGQWLVEIRQSHTHSSSFPTELSVQTQSPRTSRQQSYYLVRLLWGRGRDYRRGLSPQR